MQQYPLSFNDTPSFTTFLERLQLILRRIRRSQSRNFGGQRSNKPLDDRERRAFDIISKQVRKQIDAMPEDSRVTAEETIKEAIDVMGEREYLNLFLAPLQIMGVPYIWFVLEALATLVVFIATSNFVAVFFAAPCIHLIGYLICRPKLRQQREDSIKKLLGEVF